MRKVLLFFIILPALGFSQTRHSGNGENYIKNFQIDGTNFMMDKKLDNHDAMFLRLSESSPKYEFEIYSYSPRTANYNATYSLCYYKKVLYLVNLNYTANNEKGTEEIQKLISSISARLGQYNFKTSDNKLAWKYGNYFAQMNEISATDKTIMVMNVEIGQKMMSVVPSSYALKNNL